MKTITSMIALLMTMCLSAQNSGKISGVIKLKGDSTVVLSGVTVELRNFQTVISNSRGEFTFVNVPVGEQLITVTHSNYKPVSKQIIVSKEEVKLILELSEHALDLPEIIVSHVTITGGEIGIKELPGSAYYLSPKELEKFNNTDINRILRNVPGVNIQEEEGFGLRPSIGLRGSGVERSSKITVMEDGILIAPAPYSAPAAYYFPTVGRMQGVEVLKGSSQIKYGPFTTGGAINFISSQIPDTLVARIRLSAGSFGLRNLHAFAGNSQEQLAYSLETFQFKSDGFKELDNNASTGFNKADYLFKFRVNTKATAKIYQALSLKLGETNELSNETYLGLTKEDFSIRPFYRYAGSQMDHISTKQQQAVLTYHVKPSKYVSVNLTGYRTEFYRNWYKLDAVKDSLGNKISISNLLSDPTAYNDAFAIINGTSSIIDKALYVKGNSRDHFSQGIQALIASDFKTGSIEHDIDLGIRYHQDQQDRYQYEDQYQMTDSVMLLTSKGEGGRESNRIVSATAVASYVQYKVKYKKLTVTSGLRHEYIDLKQKDFGKNDPNRVGTNLKETSNFVSAFIPGISADLKINRKMALFAGVHKGFSPPGVTVGALPESSLNNEAGVKYYQNGFSLQFTGFFNAYSNLLGSDMAATGGLGTGDLFNGGKAQIYGVEFNGVYDVMRHVKSSFNLPIGIAYTYTDGVFLSDFSSSFEDWGDVHSGDHLPYMSNHQLAINTTLEHARFEIHFSGKYNSEMRTVTGAGKAPANTIVPSFMVMDVSAQYHLNKYFSIFSSVSNIANNTYLVALRPSGYRSGMPRAFQIGLKASL